MKKFTLETGMGFSDDELLECFLWAGLFPDGGSNSQQMARLFNAWVIDIGMPWRKVKVGSFAFTLKRSPLLATWRNSPTGGFVQCALIDGQPGVL